MANEVVSRGTEAASPPPRAERRVRVRFAARFAALCQSSRTTAAEYWSVARARDISTGGLCLVARRPFEPGVVLAIQPLTPRFGNALTLPPLHVIHVTQDSEGSWLIGGEFARPLAPKELEALLTDPDSPVFDAGDARHAGPAQTPTRASGAQNLQHARGKEGLAPERQG